jgi:hypothetical protein
VVKLVALLLAPQVWSSPPTAGATGHRVLRESLTAKAGASAEKADTTPAAALARTEREAPSATPGPWSTPIQVFDPLCM